MPNRVILVDFDDQETGTMEKMQAHKEGKLHRAFSVFLYHDDRILMQKRAAGKYHCGGLWTNTCCSHPAPGETVQAAAVRRLKEETGTDVPQLNELFTFFYYAPFANGITEFECDHVLTAEYRGGFKINSEEASDLEWVSADDLKKRMKDEPQSFTPWFIICAPRVFDFLKKR